MHELLLKNKTSNDKRRSELFLSEHFEKDHVIQDVEKRIVYAIKEVLEFTDPVDLVAFLEQKKKQDKTPQVFLIRSHNTKEGINKYIYKVVGEQVVVLDDKIFILKVSHYLKSPAKPKTKNVHSA